jgi:hypothetical protein
VYGEVCAADFKNVSLRLTGQQRQLSLRGACSRRVLWDYWQLYV